MKPTTEVKFIDFQNDERCKRLERALKLNMMKEINREEKNETYPLPMTPSSISNINMDTFESSSHSNFLQTSKIGSEVVSSSKNLRNMVLKELHTNSYKPIATSSVKRMNMTNDSQDNYSLMPPPPNSVVPSTIKTSNNASWCNDVRIQSMTESDIDKDCSKNDTSSGTSKTKKLKVFSEWRVMLNNQDKLIIKGTIHRGIYARSKPIARRLTNNIVESVCQHLYSLEGDLVDKDCDLPDYVRDKFLYGFPNDWLNVCDIWKTFISQGCKISFRWPTSITDSDDDLNNELTDVTFVAPNSPENTVSKSFKEFNISPPNNSNVLQTQTEKQNHSSHVHTLSNSFTQTSISGTSPISWSHDNKENSQQQKNATVNCLYSDNEIRNIKEKLNLIIDTLANKNSPNDCLHTIGQILDRLHYIILYGSVGANESNMANATSERNELTVHADSNERSHSSKEYCSSEVIPLQNITEIVKNKSIITDNKLTEYNDLLQKNKTVIDANKTKVTNDSDSESEIYAGVRKISVEQLLQHKKLSIQSPKRKGRRNVSHHKSNKEEKEQTSSKSEVKSITGTRKNTQIYKINHDDSSISILEDIRDNKYSSHNNYINRNVKSNVNRRSKSDTIGKQSNSTSAAPIVDNNMYEVQEHFKQKNSAFTFNIIENGECIGNEYVKSKNDTVEESFNRKAIKKCETTNYQCPNCASHEQAKNHSKSNVINSVPIVNLVDIMNVGTRFKNKKIIPPLNNWTGERVCEKENSSIQCLDNLRVSLMNVLYENPSKSKTANQQRIQGNNDSRNSSNLSELKNSITSSPEKSNDTKIRKNPEEFESNNLEKLQKAKKRQIDQQVSDSSIPSDCSDVPVQKRQKINAKRRESPNFNRSGNSENLYKHCSNNGGSKPTLRSMKSSNARTKQTFHQQSSVGSSNIVYAYYNDISTIDKVLSTDEESRI
ncbi:probable cyclin-dependent serine/threonine-protein kinase DDB_G0292550 [Colletes gigas]|uniref:probable cyclin-dependent serine/threonine-protein kinase DDB_G0292550 n=1 Tax=Colletes gigas TaxID=935657 RepID=UPI001C9B5E33|nr:probable cyclin-dependent serine/threonine-protein kinase DDB_G0292550 [Colletes gigas]